MLLQVIACIPTSILTRPLHQTPTRIETPGRHGTHITTFTTCQRAQSHIHAGDIGQAGHHHAPIPSQTALHPTGESILAPSRHLRNHPSNDPATRASRRRHPMHLCTAAYHSPTASPQRSYLAAQAANTTSTSCQTIRHPLGALAETQTTEWPATRRICAQKPMRRDGGGRHGTTRGAGRAGVRSRLAVILGRIITTLLGRGRGRQDVMATCESVRGEEVRHSGGCRRSSRRLAGA